MSDREHARVPVNLRVEFRTASSLLITYTVNLSRGGMFLETDAEVPIGAALHLELTAPGEGALPAHGVVTWRRGHESPDGPPGIGVEFGAVGEELGRAIDRLIARYRGVTVLVQCRDRQARADLAHKLRSVLSTAEVLQAEDAQAAAASLQASLDLVVVVLDDAAADALTTLRAARALRPPVPVVAIGSATSVLAEAEAAGAAELLPAPPAFEELQLRVVRALGRPSAVR